MTPGSELINALDTSRLSHGDTLRVARWLMIHTEFAPTWRYIDDAETRRSKWMAFKHVIDTGGIIIPDALTYIPPIVT